jgi:RNA polymerase I-specific transcription initiation factor RRN6
MQKILSGWVEGGDPAAYVWTPLHSTDGDGSDAEDEDTDEGALTAKQRRRSRRQEKRRRLERQHQLQQQSQSQTQATAPDPTLNPPPLVITQPWGSQPTKASTSLVTAGGSSQPIGKVNTQDEQMPMTQIERGAFGSRQAVTTRAKEQRKKKRRAAGF